jgi:hypothetical protein
MGGSIAQREATIAPYRIGRKGLRPLTTATYLHTETTVPRCGGRYKRGARRCVRKAYMSYRRCIDNLAIIEKEMKTIESIRK